MCSRKVIGLLLAYLLGSFFFPKTIFAALLITSISPSSISSANDIITISASASGLTSTTHYLQVGFTKEGVPTNYLGFTKNLSDSWYQYKSSPATSDLSSYFYAFTPVSGNWAGNIQAKLDTSDSGYGGSGNYVVKLMKYISSSSPTYSNERVIAVNIPDFQQTTSDGSTQTQNPQDENPSPSISWETVSETKLGDIFQSTFTLSGFDPNTNYYLKLRGGPDQNELNKVQTQSGSGFLSDTDNWDKFPSITTDGSGKASGTVFAKITPDKATGTYWLRLRFHQQGTDANVDSDIKTIVVGPAATQLVNTTLGGAGPQTNAVTKASRSAGSLLAGAKTSSLGSEINFVLGTQSGQGSTVSPAPPLPNKDKSAQKTIFFPLTLIPIIGGICLIVAGIVLFAKPRIGRILDKRRDGI